MLRGTRIIEGQDVLEFNEVIDRFRKCAMTAGFREIIVPSIWEEKTFSDKVGNENNKMMWKFQDKKGRDVCLIPEVTGMLQEMWRDKWSKEMKEKKIFYIQRCYRYEKPQKGRYREFLQFGVEWLGNTTDEATNTVKSLLEFCLNTIDNKFYIMKDDAKRGLSYYTRNGFEVEVEELGAQKQVAGGGVYNEGVGFAIGVDRVVLAQQEIRKIKG